MTRALLFIGSVFVLSGCAPQPPVAPVSPVVPTAISERALSVPPAVLAVQAHPLYKQAEAALANKDKARALTLMKQLAHSPTLSPESRAFCLQQLQLATQPKTLNGEKSVTPVVPSASSADCGPRALALALHSLGKETSTATLSQWAKTDVKGTSMAGLKAAAKKAGIEAEGLQVSREAVEEIVVPALAWKNQNHYVAILETSGRGENWQATIHDPNEQNPRTLGREEFLQMCGGYVLTLRK